MMEDSPCESFEPLDLPHVLTHGDEEPESFESITPESPNFTIEPVSSPILANVTRNFPQFPKVYSRDKGKGHSRTKVSPRIQLKPWECNHGKIRPTFTYTTW